MLTVLEVSNQVPRHVSERSRDRIDGVRRVVVMPDAGDWTQAHGRELLVEHARGAQEGKGPMMLDARRLRELVQLHRPSAVLCRSPLWVPTLTHLAIGRLQPRPALIGVCMMDPTAQAADLIARAPGAALRSLAGLAAGVAPKLWRAGEEATRIWITQTLASLDAIFVADRGLGAKLAAAGLDRGYWVPPGVDLEAFSPAARERERVDELRAGAARPIVWISAMELEQATRVRDGLCRSWRRDPAVILDVPASEDRDRYVAAHAHVHVFEDGIEARARGLASADLAIVAASGERWGACAEAMACARPVVVAGGVTGLVAAGRCGVEVEGGAPEGLVAAAVSLLRGGELDGLGRRGRRVAEAFERERCVQRELACIREVIEHVRSGTRVPSGLHERLPTPALAAVGRC